HRYDTAQTRIDLAVNAREQSVLVALRSQTVQKASTPPDLVTATASKIGGKPGAPAP
ncbi:MAG: hypothetical protein ACI9UU_001016, partial [Candidatus Azotimanducaceae bacterium]